MSDEILNIFKQNFIKIIENTIPEKRKETEELLSSTMEELIASIGQIEKNMTELLEKIQKLKPN